MGERTGIAWTDATANFWQSCHKVSTGCKNCYMFAEKTRYGQDPNVVVRSATSTFNAPLKWAKNREKYGHINRIFVCSWSDFFIEEADPWRLEAWEIMRRTPELTYQICTKRPERIRECLPPDWHDGLPNVWLGVTAENQAMADKRLPILMSIPAAIRWVSLEPLLGPIDIRQYLRYNPMYETKGKRDIRISSSALRGLGDTPGRYDLESSQEGMGSLEEVCSESPMQEDSGRTRCGGLSSGSYYDRQCEGVRSGASSGVHSPQGTDSRRVNHQSRGRKEEAQSSRQSCTGDVLGTTNSCEPSLEGRPCLQPGWREKLDDEVNTGTSRDHKEETASGREVDSDSQGLRNSFSDSLTDSSRRPMGEILWCIVGGESGPNARPMLSSWADSIRQQCEDVGCIYFHKQNGEWVDAGHPEFSQLPAAPLAYVKSDGTIYPDCEDLDEDSDCTTCKRVGRNRAGHLLYGKEYHQFPEVI